MTSPGGHNSAISWLPHVRVAWGGQLGTSGEIWTSSLKWLYADDAFAPAGIVLDNILDVAQTRIGNWFADAANGISSFAHMGWVKANWILASGLQAAGDTHYKEFGPVSGQVASNNPPFYQTYALTLRSGLTRGRAHSGRIFPPMVGFPTAADGYCAAAQATTAATSFATMLSQANADISGLGPNPGVFSILSPGNTTKGQAPTSQFITGVVMDRVADVQHRRTNHLARQEGTLAPVTG
jgi:hypothetical protein